MQCCQAKRRHLLLYHVETRDPVLRCLGSSPASTPLQVATYTIRSVQLESFLLDMYLKFPPVTFETLSPSHSPPTCAFSSPPRVLSHHLYHPLHPEPRPLLEADPTSVYDLALCVQEDDR